MHKTIEALYKNGRIFPLEETIPMREAKVFVTFLEGKKRPPEVKKNKTLNFKTYHCGGKIRDFTREDAYAAGI